MSSVWNDKKEVQVIYTICNASVFPAGQKSTKKGKQWRKNPMFAAVQIRLYCKILWKAGVEWECSLFNKLLCMICMEF
jgi:hypothetical protein